ncbi:MAP7 domain-containing protein 2a isoform X2 [Myripristis murdjan]|uniref:MAP7 domain-containing protein 2a isoform X2 n=1 Tax=Myripristis murdjan TaxID=586833 RepID=UPI001175C85A|nr:MAP7 domain-containing protein 2-like isoform X2 [Myripristis murdjan]
MAKTVHSTPGALTGEGAAQPSLSLLPDKRSPSNGHRSPARVASAGKTTPSSTEKKPQINGHPSPLHMPSSVSNTHAGKPYVEGYMKTDDRMRLAKERREERERSLAAREQLIREKERRARLQYERTVEERFRRLEEQRQKEELRRAAVEEKRRQQLEEERERLEALMKRSLERSLQLEQRTKRWSRGCTAGAAPCSPHRSPFRGTLNPADHNRAGVQGGSQSTPNTPKRERLRRDRRTDSPGFGSPVRRAESPASVTKYLASPPTSKLTSKMRSHSPSNGHQYHSSPTRHRPNPDDSKKVQDKTVEKHGEESKTETAVKKNCDIDSPGPYLHVEKSTEKNLVNNEIAKNRPTKAESCDKHLRSETPERNDSPDKKDPGSPKVDTLEKKIKSNDQDADKRKESAPCTPTGKQAAGTTNAEEATRLLAERRRHARAQKELEEKKREHEEEERLKAEQLKKQPAPEQPKQEAKTEHVKEGKKKEEDAPRLKKEEEKRKQEEQEKELQTQVDKEKEKAKVQAQEDAERQRQDRELQKQHEEEERQLRKKRIEEIMKRTRKNEADVKEEQVETKSVSPPGEVRMNVQTSDQVNEQAIQKVELQVNEQVPVQGNKQGSTPVKKEAAVAQMDNQKTMQVQKNTEQVTPTRSAPEKGPDAKQVKEEHVTRVGNDGKAHALKPQEKQADTHVSKQDRAQANTKANDQINKELTNTADAKVNQKESVMVNGGMNSQGSAQTSNQLTTEVSKHQSSPVEVAHGTSKTEGKAKETSETEVTRASVTPLPVGHPSPPVIKLEPLDVKSTGSCDEVQSMEVSPVSKDELISIPEFSPVNEVQHGGMSNTRALEDLLDLTGNIAYPKLSSEASIGDCNKNLIEGVVSPMSDSKLIEMSSPSSNKLSVQ